MASLFSKMSSKALLTLGLAAASMQGALAHTYLSSLYVNNQALNEGDCLRPRADRDYDSPIPLVTDDSMTCGWLPNANKPANRKCPIAAGSTVGLQWHHQSNAPTDDIVEATHQGPIIVYMAKSDTGKGNVWFKIYEDGFSNGKWAVDKLIANKGRVDIPIPSDIAPGNYLLRGEVIALHGANALNGVQPYVGCAELTISGSGSANPAGVAIPGAYSQTDPGMLFDKYAVPMPAYIIPGPAVYKSGSSPSNPTTGSTQKPTVTSAPATQKPTVTSAPSTPSAAGTTRPTNAPDTSSPAVNIKFGLKGGSNAWWLGAIVAGGSETTVKVEMSDNGNYKNNWVALSDKGYAYVYAPDAQLTLPISLRLTSSNGKQVVLTNAITSFSNADTLVDSGKAYSGSTSNPATSAPAVTSKPVSTSAPAATSKPTSPAVVTPVTGSGKVTVHSGASEWWFALSVNADVSKVEFKDSGAYSSFKEMSANTWGGQTTYSFSTSGASFVAPVQARITSTSGKVVTATISSFAPNTVVEVGSL